MKQFVKTNVLSHFTYLGPSLGFNFLTFGSTIRPTKNKAMRNIFAEMFFYVLTKVVFSFIIVGLQVEK